MKTYEKLAQRLHEVGLHDMAAKAAGGYYHDFLSPLTFPELALEEDLRHMREKEVLGGEKWRAIEAVRKALINGEFDADTAESEEWAKSPEGQDTMSRLVKGE